MSGVNGVKHRPFLMLWILKLWCCCALHHHHSVTWAFHTAAVFTLIKPHAGAARAVMTLDFKSCWRRTVTFSNGHIHFGEMIIFYGQLPLRYIYTLNWCCVFNLIGHHSLNNIKLLWTLITDSDLTACSPRETLIGDNLGRSHLSVCFWALWQHNQTTLYSRKTFSRWQLRSIQRPGNPGHIYFPMGVGQIKSDGYQIPSLTFYLWGNPLLHWCNTEKWI